MDPSGLIATGLTMGAAISVAPLRAGSDVAAAVVLKAAAWLDRCGVDPPGRVDPCGVDPPGLDPPGWVHPGSRAAPLLSIGITGSVIR